MTQRTIAHIQTPRPAPGFLGTGHLATPVIDGSNFTDTDPFILLMDDRVDLPGGPPAGGPHPHAEFETVTLVLEGDARTWETGTFELMTAGKGIIHTEEITSKTKMRILQLWLVLPPDKRWTEPRFQEIGIGQVPTLKTNNIEIRVYSGSSNGLSSPVRNHTPLTVADFSLAKETEAIQHIPGSYNGFIYMIDGSVAIGGQEVRNGQVGWLDKTDRTGTSEIKFRSGAEGARFILYAGAPQKAPIIIHGPFVGDSREDIVRLYHEYNKGKMGHVRELQENNVTRY